MKIEGVLFVVVSVFFAAATVGYWFTSYDPTGTTALAMVVGMGFLIGFYLLVTARRMQPRPEDRPDAEVAEGAGEVGFFSPHSWWPFFLALSGAIGFFGIAMAWWIAMVGAFLVLLSSIGFVMEYYRGVHAE